MRADEPFEWIRAICETFVSVELFVMLTAVVRGDASNIVICGGLTILTTVVSLEFELVDEDGLVEFIIMIDSSLWLIMIGLRLDGGGAGCDCGESMMSPPPPSIRSSSSFRLVVVATVVSSPLTVIDDVDSSTRPVDRRRFDDGG